MKLAEKQQRWKRLRDRLEKRSMKSVKNQCRAKIQHENFLSAMAHARRLTDMSGHLYTPYTCVHCNSQHVGSISDSVVWMFEGESLHVHVIKGRAVCVKDK
jgi:hypothetical protein